VVEIRRIKGRLETARRRGGYDPVPPTDAHAESDDAAELWLQDRPINLIDIARVLGESANIERLDGAAIRAWRDDLTLIRDSLSYARAILAADVAILSESASQRPPVGRDVVDTVTSRVSSSPGEDQWSAEDIDDLGDLEGLDLAIDEDLFTRTDQLLVAHRALARLDRSSAAATAGALAQIEEQLAILTERHATVEARLQQIRLVILRRYRQEASPARDQSA
jgi:hypothetical protein